MTDVINKVECPQCDREFNNDHGLGVHLARVHNTKPVENNQCSVCGKSVKHLTTHMRRVHDVRQREPRNKQQLIAANVDGLPVIGIEPLLAILFPNGVPVDKLNILIQWIDVTKELMS